MVVIPLVMSSIILGIASSGNASFLKKVGIRIVPYFIVTTTIAVAIGITMVTLLSPGEFIDADLVKSMVGDSPHLLPRAEQEHKRYSLVALGGGVLVAVIIVLSKM